MLSDFRAEALGSGHFSAPGRAGGCPQATPIMQAPLIPANRAEAPEPRAARGLLVRVPGRIRSSLLPSPGPPATEERSVAASQGEGWRGPEHTPAGVPGCLAGQPSL
ncbi:diamine acetyltransferase 2-like [Platysternon megacephalum]|uniref:Diamine acetyltransferase 2-like n=1 Tax=Platysternon megacephalum TaxID=55544 RepID=A0A4D9DPE2_9SAUR|nr:diamine acetyltransferase 2-like [Platysternon megacephalum]